MMRETSRSSSLSYNPLRARSRRSGAIGLLRYPRRYPQLLHRLAENAVVPPQDHAGRYERESGSTQHRQPRGAAIAPLSRRVLLELGRHGAGPFTDDCVTPRVGRLSRRVWKFAAASTTLSHRRCVQLGYRAQWLSRGSTPNRRPAIVTAWTKEAWRNSALVVAVIRVHAVLR